MGQEGSMRPCPSGSGASRGVVPGVMATELVPCLPLQIAALWMQLQHEHAQGAVG